jgi:hypothetical protein
MFDINAQERLGYYVYALFDSQGPRKPFYIGKGCGNRVFAHAQGHEFKIDEDEPLGAKLELIQSIKDTGGTVEHKIIRFGLSEEEAFKVEAALIDLMNYIEPETLKNQISGQGVAEGFYDAGDLALALRAVALQTDLPILIIKIERRWSELLQQFGATSNIPRDRIYEATRGDWRLSRDRALRATCVLSVARGLVRAVFVPNGWEEAGYESRKRMTGERECPSDYQEFIGTSVAHIFERGSQNPIRYLRC